MLHRTAFEAALRCPELPELGAAVLASAALGQALSITLQAFVDLGQGLLGAGPCRFAEGLFDLLCLC